MQGTQQVCMPIFNFSLLLIALMASVIWGLYNLYEGKRYGSGQTTRTVVQQPPYPPLHPDDADDLALGERPPRRRDYRKMYDPLKEPSRRYVNYPGGPIPPGNINIPTQGYLPSYQLMGYMSQEGAESGANGHQGDPRMLKLYGRKIDSNRYEYYTTHQDDSTIKIPIDRRGDQEIYDGDEIKVPNYPGKFKAHIYQYEAPKYIPYL